MKIFRPDALAFTVWICLLSPGITEVANRTCTQLEFECVFPYISDGIEHYSCVSATGGPWCKIRDRITLNKKGFDWDRCVEKCPESKEVRCTKEGHQCRFPFVYKGVNHTTCLAYSSYFSDYTWCPTVDDYQGKGEGVDWGKCVPSCPEASSPTEVLNLVTKIVKHSTTTSVVSAETKISKQFSGSTITSQSAVKSKNDVALPNSKSYESKASSTLSMKVRTKFGTTTKKTVKEDVTPLQPNGKMSTVGENARMSIDSADDRSVEEVPAMNRKEQCNSNNTEGFYLPQNSIE
ncbi:unnamed protein product [Clavelina lepadiformis]|uniref:Fibronectin type-II domain-containing protein n=1 Tax=Clavelina lepadiformis TaxID=159417 RepID=A0ABP0FME6_CLALP